MNILLVDDDIYLVDVVKTMVHWEALEIDEVYTANSIGQAKKIINEIPIDMMLCDIEMPQGSGLELIQWCREEKYQIEVIILSSYAKFEYAQNAMKMGSYDYLVKPIPYEELEAILKKLVVVVKEKQAELEERNSYKRWNQDKDKLSEIFWKNLLNLSDQKESGIQENVAGGILEAPGKEDRFLLITIDIYDYQVIYNTMEHGMNDFTVKDIVLNIGKKYGYSMQFFMRKEQEDMCRWYVIFKVPEEERNLDKMTEECEKYLSRSMTNQLKFFFGETVQLSELVKQVAEVEKLAEETLEEDEKQSISEQVKQYIDAHLDEDINRNSFSKIFYRNPDYLARLFKQEEGISIGNYLIQRRMEYAKEQLRSGKKPINTIAVQCGYTNFSYFAKLFRKYTGFTPNEFRKNQDR